MKLNRKHVHAIDISMHKLLQARDVCKVQEEKAMLSVNVNRLRQLRILMIECITQPNFDFSGMFHEELNEGSNLVKGIRMLTGYAEADGTETFPTEKT